MIFLAKLTTFVDFSVRSRCQRVLAQTLSGDPLQLAGRSWTQSLSTTVAQRWRWATFCDLVITGKCIPLKCIGFLHPHGENAQIVIMHIACKFCQSGLELLCSDEDVLQPLRKCGPSLQLGMFRHEDELEIHQTGRTSKIKMRFDKMPLSRRLYAQSGLQFDVEIAGENHVFEAVPGPPATPAPQPAPHPSGHPAGSAPQAGRAIFVEVMVTFEWLEKHGKALQFISIY